MSSALFNACICLTVAALVHEVQSYSLPWETEMGEPRGHQPGVHIGPRMGRSQLLSQNDFSSSYDIPSKRYSSYFSPRNGKRSDLLDSGVLTVLDRRSYPMHRGGGKRNELQRRDLPDTGSSGEPFYSLERRLSMHRGRRADPTEELDFDADILNNQKRAYFLRIGRAGTEYDLINKGDLSRLNNLDLNSVDLSPEEKALLRRIIERIRQGTDKTEDDPFLAFPRQGRAMSFALPRLGRSDQKMANCCLEGIRSYTTEKGSSLEVCPSDWECCPGLAEQENAMFTQCVPVKASFYDRLRGMLDEE